MSSESLRDHQQITFDKFCPLRTIPKLHPPFLMGSIRLDGKTFLSQIFLF